MPFIKQNKNRNKNKKHSLTIQHKVLILIIVAILPLNILMIYAINQMIESSKIQVRANLEELASIYSERLDSKLFSAQYYLYEQKNKNENFNNLLKQTNDDLYKLSQTNVVQQWREYINSTHTSDGLYYLAEEINDRQIILSSDLFTRDKAYSIDLVLQDITEDTEKLWYLKLIDDELWLIRNYSKDNFHYGALFSLENILNINRYNHSLGNLEIMSSDISQDFPKNSMSLLVPIQRANIDLQFVLTDFRPISMLSTIQKLIIIMGVLYLALIPVLYRALNKLIVQPTNEIMLALQAMQRGEQDYRIQKSDIKNTPREFLDLFDAFNKMADSLVELKIENYERMIEIQRIQLNNMHLQVTPHFILDIFKLIYNLAQLKEYESIQEVALYLADYFRYALSLENGLQPIHKELDLIKKYLSMCSIHAPGRFEVEYVLDEDAMDEMIPPLLIHNFIENIINHALIPQQKIKIRIKINYCNRDLVIKITDTGKGMDSELVNTLNKEKYFEDNKRAHIGIANSSKRIKFYFGPDATIRVLSKIGQGTSIIIRYTPIELIDE